MYFASGVKHSLIKSSSFLKLNKNNKIDNIRQEIKVKVNTVDNYVKENNIKYIVLVLYYFYIIIIYDYT